MQRVKHQYLVEWLKSKNWNCLQRMLSRFHCSLRVPVLYGFCWKFTFLSSGERISKIRQE